MLKIEVTGEYEVNVESESSAREMLIQMTMVLASLRHHAPQIFTTENIQQCVDMAKIIEPDQKEDEDAKQTDGLK